jgi:hypothetical protein
MADLTYSASVQPDSLPGRPYPRLPEEVSPQAYGAGVGQSLEQAGQELQRVHDQVTQQAQQSQLTAFHNGLQSVVLDLTHNPQTGAFTKQGANAFGLDQQYLPQFDQRAQALLAGIPDPKVRQLAIGAIGQSRNQLSEQLDTHELTQHQEYAAQTAQSSIQLAATQAAANFNHPDIVSSNKDTVNFNIDSLAQLKGWSPETTAYNRQKALSEFHSTIVDSMVGQGNLSQARTYLYSATAAGEIDPKAADGLQRMLLAKEDHDLAMNDKIQRDASNTLLKNAILLSQKGQLTPGWIEKYHATWEPQAYEYAYNLISGKEASTDPHVYAPLLQGAMSGQDVSSQATEALYAGRLSLNDYKAIVEKSDQPRKGYVARGADYITQSLKPNPMVPDPAGQRSLANAMDDWRQWVEDNPEATEDQARGAYRTITDHYQIVQSDQVRLFNAVPLYLVGSRPNPDLAATWLATKNARDSGKLSDAEFNRQAALIQQWVATAPKKPQPKASQ